MPKARRSRCRSATTATAIVIATAATAAERKGTPDGKAVLPPPQGLPLLRRQCTQDRLQGHAPAAALRLGAGQDRALPDHRRVLQEATRTVPRDQARPLPRASALRREVRR